MNIRPDCSCGAVKTRLGTSLCRNLEKHMTQLELNNLLYQTSTAPDPDYAMVEELLQMGADPLGCYDKDDDYDCALNELFSDGQEQKRAERLPDLIKLFLRYGMDIDSSENDVLHSLKWVRNKYGVQSLQLLMDAGLSTERAECFAIDLIGDLLMFEVVSDACDRTFCDFSRCESFEYAVKMILLLSSYDRVFKGSRYIREMLGDEGEDPSVFAPFRKWNDYRCEFEFRDYGDLLPLHDGRKVSWLLGSATVFGKESGEKVRNIHLIGSLDMDRLEQIEIPAERNLWN